MYGVLLVVQPLISVGVVVTAFKTVFLQPLRAVLADIERAVGAECAPFQFPPLTEAAGQIGKHRIEGRKPVHQ